MTNTAIPVHTPLEVQEGRLSACKARHPAFLGRLMRDAVTRRAEEELAWAEHQSVHQPAPLDTPSDRLPVSRRA